MCTKNHIKETKMVRAVAESQIVKNSSQKTAENSPKNPPCSKCLIDIVSGILYIESIKQYVSGEIYSKIKNVLILYYLFLENSIKLLLCFILWVIVGALGALVFFLAVEYMWPLCFKNPVKEKSPPNNSLSGDDGNCLNLSIFPQKKPCLQ